MLPSLSCKHSWRKRCAQAQTTGRHRSAPWRVMPKNRTHFTPNLPIARAPATRECTPGKWNPNEWKKREREREKDRGGKKAKPKHTLRWSPVCIPKCLALPTRCKSASAAAATPKILCASAQRKRGRKARKCARTLSRHAMRRSAMVVPRLVSSTNQRAAFAVHSIYTLTQTNARARARTYTRHASLLGCCVRARPIPHARHREKRFNENLLFTCFVVPFSHVAVSACLPARVSLVRSAAV